VDIGSHLIQRMLGLPPPATRDLVIEHDLRAPMADTATTLRRADQAVYLDRAHPSAIILPVRQARSRGRGPTGTIDTSGNRIILDQAEVRREGSAR
jgi:hypothetical protein